MKYALIASLAAAALVLGVLYIKQNHQAAQAQSSAGELQQQLGRTQSNLDVQKEQSARLRQQLEATRANSQISAEQAAKQSELAQQTLKKMASQAQNGTNGKVNSFAAAMFEVLNNPDTKDLIKDQQKAALNTMIDKNYSQLFADLRLTPEKAAALKDLIVNKQLAATDLSMSLITGDTDAAKRAEMLEQVKTATEAGEAKIKDFLGPDNYAQYQDYEKTMGERTTVSTFQDQLGSSARLSDSQQQSLIQAMTRERENFKFTTDLSDKASLGGDLASAFTEEKTSRYMDELDQLNQRYLAQAQNILSATQASAFEKYLKSQQAIQKAGVQMAAKMFSH